MSRSVRVLFIAAGIVLVILTVVAIQVLDTGPRRDMFTDDSCLAGPVAACTPSR
jgi:hypothetical protein